MKPSPATVIASVALFVAAGGPAEAAHLISGSTIKRGTITSKQVKDRGLGLRDLSTSARRALERTPVHSIGAAQLLEGAVGAAQLVPGAVTLAALAPDSVASANIIDKQVGNADLADSAVTAAKLASASVRKSEIAGGAVGTSELATGAVTTEKLADGAVGTTQLAPSAVTGAQVADGSLAAADFADASGTVMLSLSSPISPNACATSTPITTLPNARGPVDDDVIVATPPATWNERLTLLPHATSASSIAFTVCNVNSTNPITVAQVPVRILAIST
jgi:hypothetical protein